MKAKAFAKDSGEFDRRFDNGEDIHELTDMTQAKVTRPGRKKNSTHLGRFGGTGQGS
jgi:hypothetical protein